MYELSYGSKRMVQPANPTDVAFSYDLNTQEFQTVAGRVVQILSAKISAVTVNARIAGPNAYQDYLGLVMFCRDLMVWQAETDQPARFIFPAMGWDMSVFLKAQRFSDQLSNATFPYSFGFEVDEDISGVASASAAQGALAKVKDGIGWVPGVEGWHGGSGETYDSSVRSGSSGGGVASAVASAAASGVQAGLSGAGAGAAGG